MLRSLGTGGVAVVMDAARSISSSEDSASPVTIQGRILYDSDGGIRRMVETGGSQSTSDYGEWAVGHPITGAGTGYHIRVTHQTGTSRYLSGDGLASWVALSSDRSWLFSKSVDSLETDVSTYLVEISGNGGTTTLDSSTWTITLANAGP